LHGARGGDWAEKTGGKHCVRGVAERARVVDHIGGIRPGIPLAADRLCGRGRDLDRLSARHRAARELPFLVFAAPFIIMRNTIRGRRIERRRFEFVMIATVIAGVWSLMSGTVVVMALDAIRYLMA
jgi:hypothetical protein